MAKNKYYAVKKGRETGIFSSWAECEKATKGYSGAIYKSFGNIDDAKRFLEDEQEYIVQRINELKDDEMIAYVDGSFDAEKNCYGYGIIYFLKGKKVYFMIRAKTVKP